MNRQKVRYREQNRSRYYNHNFGRFMQKDKIGHRGGLNLFGKAGTDHSFGKAGESRDGPLITHLTNRKKYAKEVL